ncbi:MAG: ADP-ribosylglycohydrolase family protein [Lachnospiraceae bacterium]|nr:ADP-ribosylglycohydrolase family protein [Lachnospiraceae bacterium]
MEKHDRIAGGFYGLLIGDALGVPYEFYQANQLPAYEKIDMMPPAGFKKSYPQVEAGTWSDDGAQALCLLDSLLSRKGFSLDSFSDMLLAWYEEGAWAVGNKVFDVGVQTARALHAYKSGLPVRECGLLNPEGKGNGALMRVLPLALWHEDRKMLVSDAHLQCLITHGHICNQVCCALYCLAAKALLDGRNAHEAISEAATGLREIYHDMPEHERELEWSIRPGTPWEGDGTGYVVDCLRSAFMILERTSGYEEAVKQAVLLGNDTDTTACVTGGLAGILYGIQGIPKSWLSGLREREKAAELLERLLFEKGIKESP